MLPGLALSLIHIYIFFDIDEDGYEVIKVESTYVKRFAYQLNDESAKWLMKYLSLIHIFQVAKSPAMICLRASPASHR